MMLWGIVYRIFIPILLWENVEISPTIYRNGIWFIASKWWRIGIFIEGYLYEGNLIIQFCGFLDLVFRII